MFQGNKNELWIKERVSINIFFTVMQRFKKGKNASFFWIITPNQWMDLAQIFTKLFLGIPRSYKIIIQTKKE